MRQLRRTRSAKEQCVDEELAVETQRREAKSRAGEPVDPWLPIDWTGAPKKPDFEDFLRLRAWSRQHELAHPGDQERYQPALETARHVWDQLAGPLQLRWENFLAPYLRKKALHGNQAQAVPLTADELRDLEQTVQRAFCSAMRCAVRLGEMREPLTINKVFDALALGWSANFRRMHEGFDIAPGVRVQSPSTYDGCYDVASLAARDLLVAGINFDAIWETVAGRISERLEPKEHEGFNPLYYVTHIRTGSPAWHRGESGPPRSRQVHLREWPWPFSYVVFKIHTEHDPSAKPAAPGYRLLLSEPPATRTRRQRIGGGRPYLQVDVGKDAEQCLRLQERQVVLLDVPAFQEDVQRATSERQRLGDALRARGLDPDGHTKETERVTYGSVSYTRSSRATGLYFYGKQHGDELKEEAECLFKKYDKADWLVSQFREAAQQVTAWIAAWSEELGLAHIRGPLYLATKSRYFVAPNGRFQPVDLSPLGVTKKPAAWDDGALEEQSADSSGFADEEIAGLRQRWFKAPLLSATTKVGGVYPNAQKFVSLDISSSQTQILAFFLGLEQLQEAASGPEKFQVTLNAHAQAYIKTQGYTGPGAEEQLKRLTKYTWMRFLYGSQVHRIVSDMWGQEDEFGPGWKVRGRTIAKRKRYATWMAQEFIESLPGIDGLRQFKRLCAAISDCLKAEGSHEGAVFTSPYDRRNGEPIVTRWNPIERVDRFLDASRHKVIVKAPGHRRQGRLIAHVMDSAGNYPVDYRKLKQMIAPCVTHLQDAFFSYLVMTRLAERGVHSFVGIHDQWLVPAEVRVEGDVLPPRGEGGPGRGHPGGRSGVVPGAGAPVRRPDPAARHPGLEGQVPPGLRQGDQAAVGGPEDSGGGWGGELAGVPGRVAVPRPPPRCISHEA